MKTAELLTKKLNKESYLRNQEFSSYNQLSNLFLSHDVQGDAPIFSPAITQALVAGIQIRLVIVWL